MQVRLLFAALLGCLPLAARPADEKPKTAIEPVELVGKASDYFYIREFGACEGAMVKNVARVHQRTRFEYRPRDIA
jgi:hypothetical protein